ncbi:hypothetical protein [Neolewinella sp.]|uniref:hypothetical protein n=1 Tax=Neolewinella sp. TaxID=2993543 RepID=UPI003B528C29
MDQTDALPHKGHLLPDTQWDDFWNAVDAAIEQPGWTPHDRAAACMRLRRQWHFKTCYECTDCGRLLISGANGELVTYTPEGGSYRRVLRPLEE